MPERIRSRRVLRQDGDKLVIEPAELLLAEGCIARIEPFREAPEPETLDLGEHLLTPAFVNAHTHLSLAFLRGVDAARFQRNLVEDLYFHFESKLSAADVRAFARMGAYESLLSGVGCVWDHYYGETAVADALLDTGLSGVVSPTLQDLEGPGRGATEAALTATLEVHRGARYREGGVFAALGPHASDTVSAPLMSRIAVLAEQHALPVHMHLAQSCDEVVRVEAREACSPLAYLAREGLLERAPQLVLAHAIFVPERDLALLDPARHALVFCPYSQLQFGFPADVTRWSERGLTWVVATDCASSNDSMGLQKELRRCHGAASAAVTGSPEYARFLETGATEDAQAAFAARSRGVQAYADEMQAERLLARVFGLPGRLHPSFRAGAIAVGARANLIAWDTRHPAFWPTHDLLRALALSDTTQAIHTLVVNGKVIGEPGALVRSVVSSAAYQDAKREADERLTRVLC